jgi:hypothetical protein
MCTTPSYFVIHPSTGREYVKCKSVSFLGKDSPPMEECPLGRGGVSSSRMFLSVCISGKLYHLVYIPSVLLYNPVFYEMGIFLREWSSKI